MPICLAQHICKLIFVHFVLLLRDQTHPKRPLQIMHFEMSHELGEGCVDWLSESEISLPVGTVLVCE